MKLKLNSMETHDKAEFVNGWSKCICGEKDCNRVFFQKRTLLKILEPYLEKWKDLPLTIDLTSGKNLKTGFMTIFLTIEQTEDIEEEEIIGKL